MSSVDLDMESIARQHYAAVFRFCARRVGSELAADAAQETFLTAQRVMKSFRGDSTLATWLLGIANNECRRLSRKRKVEFCPLEFDVPNHSDPTENFLVDREVLHRAMEGLSLEHREAVTLHELEGLTYEEAAQVLGIPAGTVKSRIHHAFRQLRAAIFACEAVPGEIAG